MRIAKNYYKNNLSIALPIILSLAGQSFVQIVDNIMVGQLGAAPLAAVSLAGAIIMNITVIGLGLSMSLTPLAGQAYAKGDFRGVSHYFQNSIIVNFIAGLALVLILFAIIPFIPLMGQPKEVVALSRGYYILVSVSIIPMMLFMASKQFMEGIGNTKIAMVITLASNLINIALNYVFIYGKLGAPALGVTGAGLATLIARISMPLMFYVAIAQNATYKRFLQFFHISRVTLKKQLELIKSGLPISGQMVIEFFSLSFITIMMGWLGTESLAANQIGQTMINFTFMVTNGVAAASTILVSHAYGLKRYDDVKRNGYAGMQISLAIMIVAAVLFLTLGEQIASLFTNDPKVIEISGRILVVVALFELFDGLQIAVLGALRGILDVRRPLVYAIISYIFISLPVACLFGFILDFKEPGLIAGFAFGLMAASFLFFRRFNKRLKDFRNFTA